MRDPFPIPPPKWLSTAIQPIADKLSLPTLPLHFHELIFAFTFYQILHSYISPYLSSRLYPATYNNFNRRTRINWDVHVVSFVQSVFVNTYALYIIFCDEKRGDMNWAARIWGYDGASGLLQGMAGGYFIWDLMITIRHVDIFGVGMLLHAISACTVFSLGFRPFLNYYGPVFILYELSSPALNLHWFMDKLKLTGSVYQLINGIVLISTFFGCRLVWGGINSFFVFRDIRIAMLHDSIPLSNDLGLKSGLHQPFSAVTTTPQDTLLGTEDIMAFAGPHILPVWLALCYLASNIVLNVLNFYWFGKMIGTLRKRFDPPLGTRKQEKKVEKEVEIQRGVYEDGRKTVEIGELSQTQQQVKSRRRG